MEASETHLLAEADQMTESMLVRLEDWELAHLRAAMLHQVEETLNETITEQEGPTQVPQRGAGVESRSSERGYSQSHLAETNR